MSKFEKQTRIELVTEIAKAASVRGPMITDQSKIIYQRCTYENGAYTGFRMCASDPGAIIHH